MLIPGAGGDSHYWRLVAARLRVSGDDASSPDPPADDDAAHLCDHVDVVVAAARGAREAVVVAQSRVALIAAQVAVVFRVRGSPGPNHCRPGVNASASTTRRADDR